MLKRAAIAIFVGLLAYWLLSGDARRALDRQDLLTHSRQDCVYMVKNWMAGEYKTCSLNMEAGQLMCVPGELSGTAAGQEACRTFTVRYHGDVESSTLRVLTDWDCRLMNDSEHNYYLDCQHSK